jgi:hypothetical protein
LSVNAVAIVGEEHDIFAILYWKGKVLPKGYLPVAGTWEYIKSL